MEKAFASGSLLFFCSVRCFLPEERLEFLVLFGGNQLNIEENTIFTELSGKEKTPFRRRELVFNNW
jgi:hypothetical protein